MNSKPSTYITDIRWLLRLRGKARADDDIWPLHDRELLWSVAASTLVRRAWELGVAAAVAGDPGAVVHVEVQRRERGPSAASVVEGTRAETAADRARHAHMSSCGREKPNCAHGLRLDCGPHMHDGWDVIRTNAGRVAVEGGGG